VSTDLQILIDAEFVTESRRRPQEYRLTQKGKDQISFLTFPYYSGYILFFLSLTVAFLGIVALLGAVETETEALALMAFGAVLAGSSVLIHRQRRMIVELFFPGEDALTRKLGSPS
jgi:hypothetical protein